MIDTKQIEAKSRSIDKEATDPAKVADQARLYPKEVGGITEWFAIDSEGNVTQITTGGSLNLPTIPSLVPSGGAKDTILAKASATDYATNWQKIHALLKEFYFVLPAASSLADRISALGSVSGLTLNTAANDPTPDAEFGSSPDTLVITPVSISNAIMSEITVMELTSTGSIEDQGWKGIAGVVANKSNKAKTKGGVMNFATLLDSSKDTFVRVRFINTTMP